MKYLESAFVTTRKYKRVCNFKKDNMLSEHDVMYYPDNRMCVRLFDRCEESSSLDNITVHIHVRCAATRNDDINFTYGLPCLRITPGIRRTP